MAEIDYSAIPPPKSEPVNSWRPPRHVYFGRKDAEGNMEQEPVYKHQPYPSMRYAKVNGKIAARLVHSAEEEKALGSDWKDTPAAHGLETAPAFGTKK